MTSRQIDVLKKIVNEKKEKLTKGDALTSVESLSLARRVYRFIYPQEFTVGVADLKDPALLESLRELRKMLAELQRIAGGAR